MGSKGRLNPQRRLLLRTCALSLIFAFVRYMTTTHTSIPNLSPYIRGGRRPIIPELKGVPKTLGLVSDPFYNRDSCGSVRFGHRTFWTCRDSQLFDEDGQVLKNPIIDSTAGWSDVNWNRSPQLEELPEDADVLSLNSTVLRQYGMKNVEEPYFPLLDDECELPGGKCEIDGSRFVIWPDVPPMVTETDASGTVKAYSWIQRKHINPLDFSNLVAHPQTTLYRLEYNPLHADSLMDLPEVIAVDLAFWAENEIPYGNYGNVIRDGIAYLYGQAQGKTALAKVPVSHIEDKSKYKYWIKGKWSSVRPTVSQITEEGYFIPFVNAGGQGTYYFSEAWNSYVWIGSGTYANAEFSITTAPEPIGPWARPRCFWTAVEGTYKLPAYSVQAHPDMTRPGKNEIFVTYTKNDVDERGESVYTTPLILVQWEDNRGKWDLR